MLARKLKILYVDTEQIWRGGQDQLFGLMTGLRERGHQICLAAPGESPLRKRTSEKGIETFPFSQVSEASISGFFQLKRILQGRQFDIIHFNTPRSQLWGGIAGKLSGHVVVCSRRVNFPLKSKLSAWKYNFLLDAVITVSTSISRTLTLSGVRAELIHVVYEGVDLAWLDSLEPATLPFERTGPVVGIVAHLSQEKGHPVLLKAASALKSHFPSARYVIVGGGSLRDRLEEFCREKGIGEQVYFTGFRADAEALMKRFDVFCLPSLSEGLSSAILAAMATRLPVVATDVGGIPELVDSGVTGYLVPPGDSVALAQALRHLFDDPQLGRRMGEAGRNKVERQFTIERKLEETERVYLELLERKGIR